MSYSPDSPTDPTSDLPRAVAYGHWESSFANQNPDRQTSSPPDGLSAAGAYGHIARWLAQKGGADFLIRGAGVSSYNLLTNALLTEKNFWIWPSYGGIYNPLRPNERGDQRTLRGMLLWGINRSGDKLVETWASNPTALAQAIASAIQSDPDPLVRLEALKTVYTGSFPVARWTAILMPALDNAQAVLAEAPYDQPTRSALQKWLSDAKGRLLTLNASAAGLPQLPDGDHMAPPQSVHNWPLIIGVGVGLVAAVFGVREYRRRRAALPA